MRTILLFLFTLLSTFIASSAPVEVYKGSTRYELIEFTGQGVFSRYKDFLTWPGGNNLYLRVEHVYRPSFALPFSPANCDVWSDHTWFHKNADGSFTVDYAMHMHVYSGMPPNQAWWTEDTTAWYVLSTPTPNIHQKFVFGNGYTEDIYSLSALKLTNTLGVPALFTLNYMWDPPYPNPDVPCWTRYVVPANSVRQVVPSFNGCFLSGIYDNPIQTSGKVNWAGSYVQARSSNPTALADNCAGGVCNPPPIPTQAQVRQYLEFFFEHPGM